MQAYGAGLNDINTQSFGFSSKNLLQIPLNIIHLCLGKNINQLKNKGIKASLKMVFNARVLR